MTPYFSIVIPVYNRERLIRRCLSSCLSQSFGDFEIIVVDDGSSDGTVEAAKSFVDPRIRIVKLMVNKGVCPARNTGVDASRGRWIVCLDSDDELNEGALEAIHKRAEESKDEISGLRLMCRLDSGKLSPDPYLKDEVWGYEEYVRWLEAISKGMGESMVVARKETFAKVRYPDDRSLERLYHLDFAKTFSCRSCPDVVRLYHQDAEQSLCNSIDAQTLLKIAPDNARSAKLVLQRHGNALSKWSPSAYLEAVRSAAVYSLLSGDRAKGAVYSLKYLCKKPLSMRAHFYLAVGMLDNEILAGLKAAILRLRKGPASQ